MLSTTPAVRAALLGLLTLTVAMAVGAWLHVDALRSQAHVESVSQLVQRTELLAASLRPVAADRPELLRQFEASTQMQGPIEIALIDGGGQLYSTSDAELSTGISWETVAQQGTAGDPLTVVRGAERYLARAEPIGRSGLYVAALRATSTLDIPDGTVASTITATAALWGLVAGVMLIMAWYSGPRVSQKLARLSERIAQGDANSDALVRHAAADLGSLAAAFGPLGQRLNQLATAVNGARDHVAALYQVNPHYVILCTLDGKIVEANPAFYAITGLPPEAVRGGRVEALSETFPIEPLMEMATRSLREGSAIGGIEYALVDRDDHGRPVEVALRAFRQGEADLVLIQATDLAVRRTLERRVAAFSDTLDLMVDQRVQQLAAGQQSLRRLLDNAGVVIASFDAGGGTRRWSGAAQALSGRTAAGVAHFALASASLGLSDDDRAAFGRWFWSQTDEPFVAVHATAPARIRWMVWHKVDADQAGRTDFRTVIGMEVPPAPTGDASPAPAPMLDYSGDGHASDSHARPTFDMADPSPDRLSVLPDDAFTMAVAPDLQAAIPETADLPSDAVHIDPPSLS